MRAQIINAITNECGHVGNYTVKLNGEDVCSACAVMIEPVLKLFNAAEAERDAAVKMANMSRGFWKDAEDEVTKLKSFIGDEIAAEHRALDEWRENGGPDWTPDHPAMQRLKRFSEALR